MTYPETDPPSTKKSKKLSLPLIFSPPFPERQEKCLLSVFARYNYKALTFKTLFSGGNFLWFKMFLFFLSLFVHDFKKVVEVPYAKCYTHENNEKVYM